MDSFFEEDRFSKETAAELAAAGQFSKALEAAKTIEDV